MSQTEQLALRLRDLGLVDVGSIAIGGWQEDGKNIQLEALADDLRDALRAAHQRCEDLLATVARQPIRPFTEPRQITGNALRELHLASTVFGEVARLFELCSGVLGSLNDAQRMLGERAE